MENLVRVAVVCGIVTGVMSAVSYIAGQNNAKSETVKDN